MKRTVLQARKRHRSRMASAGKGSGRLPKKTVVLTKKYRYTYEEGAKIIEALKEELVFLDGLAHASEDGIGVA